MSTSRYIEEAHELLESVRGKPQKVAERQRLAIELAALMLKEAALQITSEEKEIQHQLSKLMTDPVGKAFTTAMTDECFRSSSNFRIADQMVYLLNLMGTPQYLSWFKRLQLQAFRSFGAKISQFLVPFATEAIRKETSRVILPGELSLLSKHLQERRKQEVRLNINHLGEAILSEIEAQERVAIYLKDLENPNIDYVSVKISTVFSQVNLISFDHTVDAIAEQIRLLCRAAMKNPLVLPSGEKREKFVNLDMEEYRDLHLTVAAFQKVLNDPEFHSYSAGIVLQAYLPDSFPIQKELTEWAKRRVQSGGAPIKIRIVKGANLAMEQFEASLRGWPQTPFTSKVEVDANYKKMLIYSASLENARAVRIGIASHNLFDLSFAMLIREENQVNAYLGFEMLEGMADHIRRVVQKLSGDMLLYCPVATKEEFQHAVAYLIRRLDENTGSENFLRHVFGLKPGTEVWDAQTALFSESCDLIETISNEPRRKQNRLSHPAPLDLHEPFENEPDTDFALPQNQKWAEAIAKHWKTHKPDPIPLVIGGEEIFDGEKGIGTSPSVKEKEVYQYIKASEKQLSQAITCAKDYEEEWGSTTFQHRASLLSKVAQKLRERRGEIIGASMLDGGKTILEADVEVSEAVDFAEYYLRQIEKLYAMKDISWKPKGTVLVTPPWNFPSSIPVGGLAAALITGNCVLFKPASDTILVGWHLVKALWDAGIPKQALQFIPCSGETSGAFLIQDERINAVILTGGTETAKKLLEIRPTLDLAAETGGKNSLIITDLCDRDLAVKDLLQSAFGHAGQKCSAASLAILEARIYDDPHFLRHLKEAAESLKVGLPWDLSAKINPLIHEPRGVLKRGLTSLEPGEEWLLEPKQDPEYPCLWSPGIKLHVKPGGFTHMTELFGPVLGLMRAKDLKEAIALANMVPYGLTSGIHSLDQREQALWIDEIEAGNLYINRTITGAIVRRQPFGGTKASSFGNGSKAGGPNYLREFMIASQEGLPKEKYPVNQWVNSLTAFLEKLDLSAEELGIWTASISNYAYWWRRMRQDRDPSKIVGQDNFFRYIARKSIALRISAKDCPFDALRICAACLTTGSELHISWSLPDVKPAEFGWLDLLPVIRVIEETEEAFSQRILEGKIKRVRMLQAPSQALLHAAKEACIYISHHPVLANGRLELLNYLREVSISIDYHRYGNLGLREGELRKPIL